MTQSFFDKGFNGVLIEGLELFKPGGHGSHSSDSIANSTTTISSNITSNFTTTTYVPTSTLSSLNSTVTDSVSTVASVVHKHIRNAEVPEDYYKLIMIILTGLPAIVILLMMLTILRTRYGKKAPKGAAPVMAAH